MRVFSSLSDVFLFGVGVQETTMMMVVSLSLSLFFLLPAMFSLPLDIKSNGLDWHGRVTARRESERRRNNKEKAIETVSRTEKQTRQVRKGENDDDDGQKRGDKCGQTKITSWAIKRQKSDIFFCWFFP